MKNEPIVSKEEQLVYGSYGEMIEGLRRELYQSEINKLQNAQIAATDADPRKAANAQTAERIYERLLSQDAAVAAQIQSVIRDRNLTLE